MTGGQNPRGRLQHVRTTSIRVHELDVTVPLQKQVDSYRSIFEAAAGRPPRRAEEIPAVRVGSVGGTIYLMADGDVYRGALAAGAESIRCAVTRCADTSDFLVRHVQHNHRPTGINPLLLRRVSDYVAAHGSEEDTEALSRACGGTVHQKFIALDLEPGAASVLGELCGFLGTKLSQFALPYYIPYHIAGKRRDMQEELAQQVSGLVRARPVTDVRFAWPSFEEVKTLSDSPRYRREGESAVVTPDGEKAAPKEVRRAKQLIKNVRDVIAIPGTDAHPPYLVDLKTKRASIVEDRSKVTVLRDADPEGTGASMTYLFPQEAGRWLGLSGGKKDGAGVEMERFDADTGLAEFVEKHRGARGVVFYRRA
ncbi:MAG: hypothetical protein OXP12_07275 [Thaumarchaeota archaeon]|nr:hypothetical protein [Nitrososphaerota archaeon]MDE0266225.1 hypothetical protein [Nitrososphaerota archaeon]MDE0526461.1 hypothetical protein [Nitrososphaerota archaeon]